MKSAAPPALIDLLLQQETELHRWWQLPPARLAQLLHDGFVEIGLSGQIHDKTTLQQTVLASPSLQTTDFTAELLSPDMVLLRYRSWQLDDDGNIQRPALRSSIWQQSSTGWQLRFHQGTTITTLA